MPVEHHGYSIATDSPEAAQALAEGMVGFNQWRIDALDHISQALTLDPEFPLAHAARGLILHGGRSERYRPAIAQSLDTARQAARQLSAREHLYVDALESAVAGRLNEMVTRFETLLAEHPTDLFAHRLAQQELFWGGEAQWMADLANHAAPAWSSDDDNYSDFLSVRAFGLEEAGAYELAERCGREAVERNPSDCWGAHAVAHVLIMQGRIADGMAWLEPLTENWAGRNQIVHHLWWHLCLFLLERGEHDRILHLLDTEIRNPASPLVQAVPDAYIDLQNVASLLLRLELRGVDVGARWETVADVAEQRIGNHASPFTDAHAAMILAATARFEQAEQLVDSMRTFAAHDEGTLGPRYRNAALPAARAAIAHRRGEHAVVLEQLLPARRHLWQMGGSHAQRDVFWHLLADSAEHLGQTDCLRRLRDECIGIGFAPAAVSAPALAHLASG